jgi:hypothetical protein
MSINDGFISFDDGVIKLNGTAIPGIFVSMTVNAGVRFDRAEKDHMSGKNKLPLGWEDADIKVSLDLICEYVEEYGQEVESTCYMKLSVIDDLFKNSEKKKADPKIYDIASSHLDARGIKRVVFSGLESIEDDQSDVIRVTLAFSEHLPVVAKREKQVNATKTPAAPAIKTTPAISTTIVSDPPGAFRSGLNAGLK